MKHMKLKFYDNPKTAKDEIYIGKTGQLRFKAEAVNQFGIEKGQRFRIGVDGSEAPIKHIYLVKSATSGFKVSYGNSTYLMNTSGVWNQLNAVLPIRCKYESFSEGDYEGIKLILPKPIKVEVK